MNNPQPNDIKEAKREERERMLGWLKEALFEEEFSKVKMIINGHLLHPAEEGEEGKGDGCDTL